MGSSQVVRSVWVRLGLGVLTFEAVLLVLTWLMNRYWFLKSLSFGDALLLMGVLACFMASAGMMRSPYGGMFGPAGVPALPIQATDEEKRVQSITETLEQRSFTVRLLASGLLSILLSIMVTYIK